MLFYAYLRTTLEPADEERVRQFLVEQSVYENRPKDSLDAGRIGGKLTESYKKAKLLSDAEAAHARSLPDDEPLEDLH